MRIRYSRCLPYPSETPLTRRTRCQPPRVRICSAVLTARSESVLRKIHSLNDQRHIPPEYNLDTWRPVRIRYSRCLPYPSETPLTRRTRTQPPRVRICSAALTARRESVARKIYSLNAQRHIPPNYNLDTWWPVRDKGKDRTCVLALGRRARRICRAQLKD